MLTWVCLEAFLANRLECGIGLRILHFGLFNHFPLLFQEVIVFVRSLLSLLCLATVLWNLADKLLVVVLPILSGI